MALRPGGPAVDVVPARAPSAEQLGGSGRAGCTLCDRAAAARLDKCVGSCSFIDHLRCHQQNGVGADVRACWWPRRACLRRCSRLARMQWLRQSGAECNSPAVLAAVLQQADMAFILRLEEEGGYLPCASDLPVHGDLLVLGAAAASRDSAAKLQWLARQGVDLSHPDAMSQAALHGNLEALQLLVARWRANGIGVAAPPHQPLHLAVLAGHVASAIWLQQEGSRLVQPMYWYISPNGDLDMIRWLLQAGYERDPMDHIALIIFRWPRNTAADGERLVEAVRLLNSVGWPLGSTDELMGACHEHPWAVWRGLVDMRLMALPPCTLEVAADAGCQATMAAFLDGKVGEHLEPWRWYSRAAEAGDQGTLAWLVQKRVPLDAGMVLECVGEAAPAPALRWVKDNAVSCEPEQLASAPASPVKADSATAAGGAMVHGGAAAVGPGPAAAMGQVRKVSK